MKIVVIAPNVSENVSGEAIKAFQYIKNLVQDGVTVTLITHARSRGHIDTHGGAIEVVHVEDDFWQGLVWRSILLRPLIDIPFFLAVRRMVKRMAREDPATIFHYLGPVSPILPRFPVASSNSVLGPITGNIYYPPALRTREPFSLKWRRISHGAAQRAVGFLFHDKAKFREILVSGGERTRQSLKWAGAHDRQMRDVIDAGVSNAILRRPKVMHEGENSRFVITGRLMPHKRVDLAIRAVAKSNGRVTLDIFGKGPEKEKLQALIEKLKLQDRVVLRGWSQSHDDLLEEMSRYRGFVFPSMAEANGIAVQEALAMGLPVICLNWGGPTLLTNERTALRVEPLSDGQIVEAFAAEMDQLAQDPALATKLSKEGFEAARRLFSWEAVSNQWRAGFVGYATADAEPENAAAKMPIAARI